MSNGGGGSSEQELADQAWKADSNARAYDHALTYAHIRAYVSLSVKTSGLLALLLSSVILLGGYVQSLEKKDFFCIMSITLIQAAGIFQDWETNGQYLKNFLKICRNKVFRLDQVPALAPIALPFVVLILCVLLFYFLGPLACAAISSWRIAKLDHGNNKDTDMTAALNIFYSLIIFQGAMFLVLLLPMNVYRDIVAHHLHSLVQPSEKWVLKAILRYLSHISTKCRKDLLSIKGMDLIKYGAELLDSESQEDYLYGTRLLSAFVSKGGDVSWVLLPSTHRQRIQRLIDSLVISSSSRRRACLDVDEVESRSGKCYAVIGSLDDKKEIRELAATILADVAAHIDDLSNYPGAMRCISSLLQHPDDPPLRGQRPIGRLTKQEHYQEEWNLILLKDQQRIAAISEHRHRHKREGGTSYELVQGLTILERLASNSDDNRKLICSTPGLLPKITAPVYSATFIQDIKTKAWADIVTRCLKVLYQLIRTPDGSHEIFSNNVQALSNLKSILELGNTESDHQELQLVAMEILTELAMDPSINLSVEIKNVLVTKQLQLFLANEESASIAGRTLVSLSTNSDGMTTENSIIGRLTGTLDDENITRSLTGILDDENITRRTIAAEIMANLCAHCNVENMKELLPKVLGETMPIKAKSQEREESGGQNNPASGDEENQGNSVSTNNEERHNISTQGDDTEIEEISDQKMEEQEAFLSLAQVICDKLSSADLDGAIQNAVQNENNGGTEEERRRRRREAFVDNLRTIIDNNNCHPAADSLRIVKLCGQIAKSVMQCQQYAVIFRDRGFKISLSKASETMSELESCMLFVGTDFGPKKTVRPLFSEIEESFGQI